MGIDWALVGLFMTSLLANSVYSVIAPFYPQVAGQKGVRSEIVGIIFSAYPIAAFMTSPILGLFISKIGRKRTLAFGGFLIALTMFGFGITPLLTGLTFTCISFLTRFLQGVGGGVIGTATYAIIASNYPENMSVVLGIQNTIAGIGMMVGPLLGSLLYGFAGFSFLFFVYGGMFLLLLPISYLLIPRDKPYEKPKHEVSLWSLILHRTLLMDGLVVSLSMITMSFLEPILSNHLETYGLSVEIIGVMFTIPTVSYATTAVFLGKLPKTWTPKVIMLQGLIISALSLLLIGPWGVLPLPRSLWVVVVGLMTLGVGIAECVLPALPDMVQAAKTELPEANPDHVSDATSGLMTSYFFLGEIAGPPLAGFLQERLGFANGAAAVCVIVLVYILLFGLVGHGFLACFFCLTGQRDIRDSKLQETLTSEEEMVVTAGKPSGKEEEIV